MTSIKTKLKPNLGSQQPVQPKPNVQYFNLDSEHDHAGYPKSLLKKLYEAALEGLDTDVILVFGKFDDSEAPKVHVHSSILKTESSVFKAWMSAECWNSEFIKSSDGKTMISLPADDPEEFRSFLKLLYGQKGPIKKEEFHLIAIPAFKMADKYGALDVMKVCEQDYFPVLINNLNGLNAAEVMIVAQKYGVTAVSDAVVKFVLQNPLRTLIYGKYAPDWAMCGEEVLVRLLSTDNYSLFFSGVVYLTVPYVGWGQNEKDLCNLASRWLKRGSPAIKEDDDNPPSPKRARILDTSIAVRVLQNIRFLQMSAEELRSCLLDLHDVLTPHQIGIICLVCSGISQDKIKVPEGEQDQFVVNTEMRYVHKTRPITPVSNGL